MSADTAFELGRLYQPIKQIADALSASQEDVFIGLPGLMAYFPMGIRFANGSVVGHSGAGASLVQTGVCPVGYDGRSFAGLGDGTNYLYTTSGLGITGLETFIEPALRGLTVGCWFKVETMPVVGDGVISKSDATPDVGYALAVKDNGETQFFISQNGTALSLVLSSPAAIGQWRFLVGRFTPSAEVAVFVDGVKTVNTTSIGSSINVSSQNFEVGRYLDDNTRILHGETRDVFVCAAALSDNLIEQTRVASSP